MALPPTPLPVGVDESDEHHRTTAPGRCIRYNETVPEKSTPRRQCTRCGIKRLETSFSGPRGKLCKVCRDTARRKGAHGSRIKRTYAITAEEYDAIRSYQLGACGGCGETRNYNLHVEHDHKREREAGTRESIRGLACARCNSVLRKVRDNPAILRKLADYLDDPPAQKVLKAL